MPPKRTLPNKQGPAKGSQLPAVQKITKPAPSTRTNRAQAERSPNVSSATPTTVKRSTRICNKTTRAQAGRLPSPSAKSSDLPEPAQQPSPASKDPTRFPQTTRRKRSHGPEDEYPNKRQQQDSGTAVGPIQKLSKTNLEDFNRQSGSDIFDGMGDRKRSLSQRTSNADLNQDTTSSICTQKSSTYANYRWTTLDYARIFVENGSLPNKLQSRVSATIQPRLSKQVQNKITVITDNFCNAFVDVMKGASREDDSVEPIHSALVDLDSGANFMFPRKVDWDTTLKPVAQQKLWHFNMPSKPNDTSFDSLNRPSKRQQADCARITPDTSDPAMQPTMPPPMRQPKTPRPDITAGLRDKSVINKLMAHGLRELEAGDFLKALQYHQQLCSNPLQPAYPIRFPPLVVEGKSYSTGKPVFEAQNQAAISGSCMNNLQHKLAELTERTSPGCHQSKDPLSYTICTEGPMMQLWVHYTTVVDGERIHKMNILMICHASPLPALREGVKDFFTAIYGVMTWATTELLDDIAKQLFLVWKATTPQHESAGTG